jgi:hypothetical protein
MYLTSVVAIVCSVIALTLSYCTPCQWEAEEGVFGGYADRRHHGLIRVYLFCSSIAATEKLLNINPGPQSVVFLTDNFFQFHKLFKRKKTNQNQHQVPLIST